MDFDFLPGSTQDNLKIENCSLPGIVNYYVQGYLPAIKFKGDEEALNEIPDYITDYYQNSVNGKTLGPVDPPSPFEPVAFTNKIIGYVAEAGTLNWITDATVKDGITAKLTTAKGKIGTNNPDAKVVLDTLLADLETKHGAGVNDEAYFLIKFNVLYLKDRL